MDYRCAPNKREMSFTNSICLYCADTYVRFECIANELIQLAVSTAHTIGENCGEGGAVRLTAS